MVAIANTSTPAGAVAAAILRILVHQGRHVIAYTPLLTGFSSGEIAPGYEEEAKARKLALFQGLCMSLPSTGAAVVEVGVGSFNTAGLYTSLRHADIIGVEPNDKVTPTLHITWALHTFNHDLALYTHFKLY